ncbi:hypothetical protein ASD11_14955 [Aeromicrobium sp. Root495]|nr:hypothetical protein ASD11_14955 [Aeromicrobium sp. Root495]
MGRDEALLVWVRKNFHDGAVDVIPVVLDVELADEQTVLVPASESPLRTDLAATTALRAHLHPEAFIDRIGMMDIASDVEDVLAAQRAGQQSSVSVGPKIQSEDDERLEYRQALRDLIAELTPSAWTATTDSAASHSRSDDLAKVPEFDHLRFEREVSERLPSSNPIRVDDGNFDLGAGMVLTPFYKVAYLDTAVLIVVVESLSAAHDRLTDLASACRRAVRSSPDVDAVCVTEPTDDWESLLFSRASLRGALELPSGLRAGPVPVLVGLGLLDTLWKHLEGSVSAWEATDDAPAGLGSIDIASIAARHAHDSIGKVETQGRRALQEAKKKSWTNLHPELSDQVTRFVAAVTGSTSPSEALSTFERETRCDQDS